MRKKCIVAIACSMLLLSGCGVRVQKNWAATGGSRADATVRLSYEYAYTEIPQLDEQEALNLATTRCQSWGYHGAEAFGGITRACNQPGGWDGCARWLVTKEYQCIGKGDASPK